MTRRQHPRPRLRVTTVIGELLILAGLGILGFLVWQPWHTGVTVQKEQRGLSSTLSAHWDSEAAANPDADPDAQTEGEGAEPEYSSTIPIVAEHGEGEDFAIIHVPAFGREFQNIVSEGVLDWLVLDPQEKGVGRYTHTSQFGELGNVALSAHRSGPFTTPFKEIMELRVGDPVFIETKDGWYTYRHRSLEYVWPNEVDVLNPFPRIEGTPGEDRILSLITCHPKQFGNDERAVAYTVFEGFTPRAEGPPAELLELNPALAERLT